MNRNLRYGLFWGAVSGLLVSCSPKSAEAPSGEPDVQAAVAVTEVEKAAEDLQKDLRKKAYGAKILAEKALRAHPIERISDEQGVVFHKREVDDLLAKGQAAYGRGDWGRAALEYTAITGVVRKIVDLDLARSGAAVKEKALSAAMKRVSEAGVTGLDSEIALKARKLFDQGVVEFEKGRFTSAGDIWQEGLAILTDIEENAKSEEKFFEAQALLDNRLTNEKWLFEKSPSRWAEIQQVLAEAKASPPGFKKGLELYAKARELMDLATVEIKKNETLFNYQHHLETAKNGIQSGNLRDVLYHLGEAVLMDVPDISEAANLLPQYLQTNTPGMLMSVEVSGVSFRMTWVPPTSHPSWASFHDNQDYYLMGERDNTKVKVKIPLGFWMGQYEVTRAEWEAIMGPGTEPASSGTPDMPKDGLTFDACEQFVKKLNTLYGGEMKFRLPSEAEWEYACRAGTTTRFFAGDEDASLDKSGWYWGNSKSSAHPVGAIGQANAWNLYDMHGNVWEWCADHWYYAMNDNNRDGSPEVSLVKNAPHILRGGSWKSKAENCTSGFRRSLIRTKKEAANGLRLVLSY